MSARATFSARWINETGKALTPEEFATERYESVLTVLTHNDCGGRVHISTVGTQEYADCRRCGARWQQLFTSADSDEEGGWRLIEAGRIEGGTLT